MAWHSIGLDLKFAWRLLRRAPVLSAVAVACLAVAIGFTTAAFGVVYNAFLSPLPVPGGERIVTIQQYHRSGSYNLPLNTTQFALGRQRGTAFEDLGAWYSRTVTVGDGDGAMAAGVVRAAYVSPNVLDVLRVTPEIGRGPSPSDVQPGAEPVAVIGHALWRDRFGGDAGVLGRAVAVGGVRHVVIGVMPPRFAFPFDEAAWIPVRLDPAAPDAARTSLSVFGRLREGASAREAEAEWSVVLNADRTEEAGRTTALVMPFTRGFMSRDEERSIYLFVLGLVALLALTAANLANLFFARNAARSREIAVRAALGAGRQRLVRQLLLESLMLACGGALAGLGIARAALVWFQGRVEDIPWWVDLGIDGGALTFTLLAALVVTAIAGTGPALRLTRGSVVTALQQGQRSLAGVRFSRIGASLLVAQIALAVGFLTVVSVLARGLYGFSFETYGVAGGDVLVAQIYMGRPDYQGITDAVGRRDIGRRHADRSLEEFEAIRRRIEQEPGVRVTALATHFPGNDREAARIELAPDTGGPRPAFVTRTAEVGAGFFDVLGPALLAGRTFTAAEMSGPPRTVVVNEPFARKYFEGQSPLGRMLRLAGDDSSPPGPWLEIVGVAPDLGLSPGDASRADGVYLPFVPSSFARLAVRTDADPSALIPRLHEIVREVNPEAQIQATQTLQAQMTTAESLFRGLGIGLSLLGGASLLLSVVSFYSLVSFGVTRRTREIGIRLALGASRRSILVAVLGRHVSIVAAGGVAGLGLGVALYQLVANMPFDLSPAGPSLAAVFAALMVLVGAGACVSPARRALAIDPADTMRLE